MQLTDIHVRAFVGAALKPYLHSLAKLRGDVFREYPYLAEPDLARETNYLRKFAACKEAIGVIVFDNTTVVGASLGLPLSLFEEYRKLFLDRELAADAYYFFTESALLKNYRGRGIGHHFFDLREAHVHHLKKYQHICFCTPTRREKERPSNDLPLTGFWRKRGYVYHSDLQRPVSWKDVDQEEPTEKMMTFWIKDLH